MRFLRSELAADKTEQYTSKTFTVDQQKMTKTGIYKLSIKTDVA